MQCCQMKCGLMPSLTSLRYNGVERTHSRRPL